jgi:CheY-like chemotaxis protein
MATIPVVDDDETLLISIATMLRKAGHIVVTANGVETVALFRSSRDRFDLILIDLRMPVMDGHQLVKLVRETNNRAKIVCMSGVPVLRHRRTRLEKPVEGMPHDLSQCRGSRQPQTPQLVLLLSIRPLSETTSRLIRSARKPPMLPRPEFPHVPTFPPRGSRAHDCGQAEEATHDLSVAKSKAGRV